MFKRTQRDVDDSSKHWYQDKYQHVLVQRNVLALISLVALACAFVAVLAVMHFAPLKTVEPYLIQIDTKTGVTQKVDPVTRDVYAASEAVDRYFVSQYVRARESYNFSILRSNYNLVRLMSTVPVLKDFSAVIYANTPTSLNVVLGTAGLRDVKINSMSYVQNPPRKFGKKEETTPMKIMQARITTTDTIPNAPDVIQKWIVTINFEYASLNLTQEEQLFNPLGFTVMSYQIQREIN